MSSYFITGCSRGIGFALASLLATKPESVVGKIFAGARNETDALKKLTANSNGRVQFVPIEVTNEQSVKQAFATVKEALGGKGLDILINNAGIMNYTMNGIENMSDLAETYDINVVGVHNVTGTFLPLLRTGSQKKIINISTTLGSIAMAGFFKHQPTPAYKVAKAALNMLTVQYAHELDSEGFTVLAVCPGWVKTDLGSEAAHISVEQSVSGLFDVVFNADASQTGSFRVVKVPGWKIEGREMYDGSNRPW
ncbi:short-chain dehydrogenase/reductase SDR [Colletotrichum godetiae]|uniref:Short-chain dehydrogenase/reductase SDR n=1 Tax=Colletotrichum godetiae TaxID=1209918 RepID=A0AAJ0A5P4_9PEZI|nr:short-chain dehydrogenase/reductase SDR [Colletotrichum godetiae]KAK1656967.1 short-chain dehydrogenase/reductase SDR [Colletotrichum godetiae]